MWHGDLSVDNPLKLLHCVRNCGEIDVPNMAALLNFFTETNGYCKYLFVMVMRYVRRYITHAEKNLVNILNILKRAMILPNNIIPGMSFTKCFIGRESV